MSDFRPDQQLILDAFHHVMAGVTISEGLKADLFDQWLPAANSGDPRAERDALFVHLGHHGWRWSWLDDWVARLSGGPWPLAWNHFGPPYNWDGTPVEEKLQMLRMELMTHAYKARDFKNSAPPDLVEFFRFTLQTHIEACPVEQGFLRLHREAIEAGDYAVRPPYYPFSPMYLRPISHRRWAEHLRATGRA